MLLATDIMTSFCFNGYQLSLNQFGNVLRIVPILEFLPYFVNKILLSWVPN